MISRIALCYPMDLRAHAQILARTEGQSNLYREHGAQVQCYSFDRGGSEPLPEGHRLIRGSGLPGTTYFTDIHRMYRELVEFQPEIVVLRHSVSSAGVRRIAESWPTVLEVHSDDLRERTQTGIKGLVFTAQQRLHRDRIMKSARGGVFVSSELAALESYEQLEEKTVITNGIQVPVDPLPAPNNLRPVVGYSIGYDAPWQGVDRLLKIALTLTDVDFRLITSESSIMLPGGSPCNLQIIYTQNQQSYHHELRHLDVALGTLALDRKGLAVSASLKVRESVSLGIPTFLFSLDEDLTKSGSNLIETSLDLEHNPQTAINKLAAFVQKAKGRRIGHEHRHLVDLRIKAKQYYDFLQHLS